MRIPYHEHRAATHYHAAVRANPYGHRTVALAWNVGVFGSRTFACPRVVTPRSWWDPAAWGALAVTSGAHIEGSLGAFCVGGCQVLQFAVRPVNAATSRDTARNGGANSVAGLAIAGTAAAGLSHRPRAGHPGKHIQPVAAVSFTVTWTGTYIAATSVCRTTSS